MKLYRLIIFQEIFVLCLLISVASPFQDPIIVTRDEWHARPPKYVENMSNPVPYVVIHHSYQPAACYNLTDCIQAMKWMQDLHQITNGWADIGYSFAVAGDGRVYEGRGWSRVGAHAPLYNNKSIGICLIGDWREELPPEDQLAAVHQLIEKGVREGYIQTNYELVGHKQVREGTECPGDRLYKEIHTWPHYSGNPHEIALRNKKVDKIEPVEDKDEDAKDGASGNRLQKRRSTS